MSAENDIRLSLWQELKPVHGRLNGSTEAGYTPGISTEFIGVVRRGEWDQIDRISAEVQETKGSLRRIEKSIPDLVRFKFFMACENKESNCGYPLRSEEAWRFEIYKMIVGLGLTVEAMAAWDDLVRAMAKSIVLMEMVRMHRLWNDVLSS